MTKLEELLRLHEGVRKKPYKDTKGILTIGVGRNLRKGLTTQEINFLLKNDIAEARLIAVQFVGPSLWANLTEVRRTVLIDMAFNMGYKLMRFNRFQRKIEWNMMEDAALEMISSKWYKQTKTRAKRLVKMWRTNQWPKELK